MAQDRDVIASKWMFYLREMAHRMWFRASLYCALAIGTVLISPLANSWVPGHWATVLGASSIDSILNILASSMLAVTTFSLTTVVSAFATASSSTTPRATKLLIENADVHSALATFLGAFLYAIVGIVALSTDIYADGGRVVLFGVTVLVIVLITVTLLRWIDQISHLGRVGETVNLVESTTRESLIRRARQPYLGGQPYEQSPVAGTHINTLLVGYVQYVDMGKLQALAEQYQCRIHLESLPGEFLVPGQPLVSVDTTPAEALCLAVRAAIVIGDARTYHQDPRLGLIVLNEIAIRALSPAINDPGTAIDVIGTCVRLLHTWAEERQLASTAVAMQEQHQPRGFQPEYDRIYVRALAEEDFFRDVFVPISRDGAAFVEVGIWLQKALYGLQGCGFAPFHGLALAFAEQALARCQHTMSAEQDIAAVTEHFRKLKVDR